MTLFLFALGSYIAKAEGPHKVTLPEEISIKLQNYSRDGDKVAYLMDVSWANRVSNPVVALNALQCALDITVTNRDDYVMASVYNYAGVVNFHLMNYLEALDCFSMAEKCAATSKNMLQHAFAYNNMALVYIEQGKYRSALVAAHSSLDVMNMLGNKKGAVSPTAQLSLTFANIFEYDSAFYYAKMIKKYADAKHDADANIRYYKCIGKIYATMAEYEKSDMDFTDKALYNYFAVYNDFSRKTGVDNEIANVYVLRGDYSKAVEYAFKGFFNGREIEAPKQMKDAIKIIIDNIDNSNKKDSAGYYIQYLFRIQDSLANSSSFIKMFALNNATEMKIREISDRGYERRYNAWQKMTVCMGVTLIMIFSLLFYQIQLGKKIKKSNEVINTELDKNAKLANVLEESINSKDKFISIIAHDLRNPISSYSELTKTMEQDYNNFNNEEKQELLGVMKQSAESVQNLLANLLEWSNTQQGKIEFKPKRFDIKELVNHTMDLLKVQAYNKKIRLINELIDPCIIYADENLITTVIRNLISNAIKFTNEDGEIRFGMDNKNFSEDRFYIRDNGVGMSQEKASTLFDVAKSTSTVGTSGEKGTGLGLIISYEFIKMHGGEITVESEEGKGTTFYFTISLSLSSVRQS